MCKSVVKALKNKEGIFYIRNREKKKNSEHKGESVAAGSDAEWLRSASDSDPG